MTYTVKRGDTLSEIAEKYQVTVEALVASNGIRNPDIIKAGQKLIIPEAKKDEPEKSKDSQILEALNNCLAAIEDLEEFKTLSGLLEED